jgi:hypothetical protein
MKTTVVLVLTLVLTAMFGTVQASDAVSPQDYATLSRFTWDGKQIGARSAFVEFTDEFFGGQAKALQIVFLKQPITDEARNDLIHNAGRTSKGNEYAHLILFIDEENQLWQVNLSMAVPGKTITSTVASRPDELKQFASRLDYDGKRLALKTKGSFTYDKTTLGWDVALDGPVFDRVAFKRQ